MPVAGNNVEVLPMRVVNGQLVEYTKTRRPSGDAMGVQDALEALRRGDVAFVKLYGSNVPDVRSAWRVGNVGGKE